MSFRLNVMDCYQQSSLRVCTAWIVLMILELKLDCSEGTSQAEINKHLEMGRDFLSRGQLQDALSHYHAAVEGDPSNYLTHFKRATVYLALGKSKFALQDLDRVLELKPDFTAARLQRGMVHLKQAQLDEAERDFNTVLGLEENEEAYWSLMKITPARHDIELTKAYIRGRDYIAAIELLTKIIEVCPWSSELREMRADCHTALGNIPAAVSDIRSTTKLQSDNTAGFFKLAMLHYQQGNAEESLKEVRECLKLDPEHKDCFPHYKKVKKVEKHLSECVQAIEKKEFKNCITAAKKVLAIESKVPMVEFEAKRKLCHCYLHDNQPSLSVESCSAALRLSREPDVFCDRAEAYINSDLFDDAIRDYHEALEIDENFGRAKDGLSRAQKLQKQSERRDYYKILGVTRSASKQEIIKAYRKAAQKWHPDSYHGEEKKKAEKKFIDIAAAKEVLTDPEKRQQFDRGEDPLDPEAQQQNQGFNPFAHHHFHGSPFQFKFHFN